MQSDVVRRAAVKRQVTPPIDIATNLGKPVTCRYSRPAYPGGVLLWR